MRPDAEFPAWKGFCNGSALPGHQATMIKPIGSFLRQCSRLLPVQLGLVGLVVLLVWASIGLLLKQEHELLEQSAWTNTGNLARGFGESINRTVESVDQVMLTIRALYRSDPARFDIAALAPRAELLNELTLQISITDAQGVMRGSNLDPKANVDLSDREHIRTQLTNPADILFISRPVLGRVSQKWSIQFTRKLFDATGQVAGVLIISLDASYFARFYESLDIGRGLIALVGLDEVVRARAPLVEGAVGSRVSPAVAARISTDGLSGMYRDRSRADGVERLYSYRRLEKHPLAVIVGLSVNEVFRPYVRDRLQYIVFGATLTVLVLLIGAVLIKQARSEALIQRSLLATLGNISQGILKFDGDQRVRVINQRAINLLELPPELAQPGVSFEALLKWQLADGEFAPLSKDAIDVAALARAGGLGPEIYERTRRNGIVLEIRTQRLPHGGAVRTFTDITARKANEQALANALELAQSAQSAQADFLAMMSHEIRTPINGIIGMAGLLTDSELSATQRRFAATLCDAADSLMHIIDDILDVSKLDAHRMEFEQIPFDLGQVLTSVVELMRIKAVEKKLDLRCTFAPDTPVHLCGDPGRLRQVVLNLVSNAIKFTTRGHVCIEVTGAADVPGSARIVIAVRDTGIGIPVEAQGRLFERFYQVDRSISREFGGTGLGLAICRRLAERMGGDIEFESRPGEGSVFQVTLHFAVSQAPVLEPLPGTTSMASLGGHKPQRRLHILLAEDNATNQLVAVTRLEMMGHRVHAVGSGTAAVAAVETGRYDLILMDVMMPEMDGLAATGAIRAMPEPARDTPIVALTASAFRRHQEECRAAGMDDFLSKPFLPAQLGRVIERAIAGQLRPTASSAGMADDAGTRHALVEALGEDGAHAVMAEFVAEARRLIGQIGRYSEQADEAGVTASARALSEAARSVGFERLGAMAATTPAAGYNTAVLEAALDTVTDGWSDHADIT